VYNEALTEVGKAVIERRFQDLEAKTRTPPSPWKKPGTGSCHDLTLALAGSRGYLVQVISL